MRSRRSLLLLFAVLAALAVGWRVRRHARTEPAPAGETPRTEAPPAQPEPNAPRDAPQGPEPEHEPAASPSGELAPIAGELQLPSTRLRGSVVSLDDGWGLAEARVELTCWDAAGRHVEGATTNVHGGFELDLRSDLWPLGTFVAASVIDLDGFQCFDGLVRLEQDVELLVAAPLALRGVLTTDYPLAGARLSVTLAAPPRRVAEFPHPLGRCEVGPDGVFELRATLAEPTTLLHAIVKLETPTNVVRAGFEVSLASLTSVHGVDLRLEVSTLRVRLVDEARNPLEGARVQFGAPGTVGPVFGASRATDSDGRVEELVARGAVELWMRCAGHAARRELVDVTDQLVEREIVLRELGRHDDVYGVVVDESGASVEGAAVVFAPLFSASAVGIEPETTVQAGPQGEFRAALASDEPYEVFARHDRLGSSRHFALQRDGSTHVLTLKRPGAVRVDLATENLPGPFRSGGVEYLLVSPDGFERVRGVTSSLPFDVGSLWPGTYEVYVLAPGFDGCAASSVTVEDGRREELTLAAQPAFWISGRVTDGRGAPREGIDVFAIADWSAHADEFGYARTNAFGELRAFSPRSTCTLQMFEGQRALGERRASVGSAIELVVN